MLASVKQQQSQSAISLIQQSIVAVEPPASKALGERDETPLGDYNRLKKKSTAKRSEEQAKQKEKSASDL